MSPRKKNSPRKIIFAKSSETRFPKVSRRSELSSGGKRPFKIFKFFVNVQIGCAKCTKCENWQSEVLNFWPGVLPRNSFPIQFNWIGNELNWKWTELEMSAVYSKDLINSGGILIIRGWRPIAFQKKADLNCSGGGAVSLGNYHHIIMSSYHHIIISSYHHIIISLYHHIIISPSHHITISSFSENWQSVKKYRKIDHTP